MPACREAFSAPEDTRAYSDGESHMACVSLRARNPRTQGGQTMTKKNDGKARALGVEFLLETPVHKIIMEDGRAVGVLARTSDGENEARAKSVILATGGLGQPGYD